MKTLIGLMFVPFFVVGSMWFLMAITMIGLAALWISMLIDVANRKFKNENDKLVWILVLALTHAIGGLIYFVVVKIPDKK